MMCSHKTEELKNQKLTVYIPIFLLFQGCFKYRLKQNESRYFSVVLDGETGELVQVDTSRIVSVDRSTAIAFAQSILQEKGSSGFADHFRYIVKSEEDIIRITFLDCGRRLDSFRGFLFASVGISLLGYVVVFILITFCSNRIVHPIAESYEKQKRFITDAGHEIKTPLTIINADADVLAMDIGENEWLEDIQKQAARLTSLTNDLIYLARMEEGTDTVQMIEFPFSDVVSEAAASFQALAQTQNREFVCDIQPMLSFYGNEKSIQQLVNILLDNALKYSPEGSTVRVKVQKQNRMIQLLVCNATDNAISKEELHLLFERFYRRDPSRNTQTGGYGIGLSVAKAIVTAHNGKIWAGTGDGQELQITVSFPSERTAKV